jgi:hypothetical protein
VDRILTSCHVYGNKFYAAVSQTGHRPDGGHMKRRRAGCMGQVMHAGADDAYMQGADIQLGGHATDHWAVPHVRTVCGTAA